MLKHGILGLLNYSDMTGYEIRETFNNSLNFFWPAQSSQIYRELHTLEDKGWITSQTVEQTGKPDKNVCHITDAGREELLRWLSAEADLSTRSSLLMKVFFLGELSDDENITFFHNLADECRRNIKALNQTSEITQGYEAALQSPKRARFWKMTIDYGKRTLQSHIDWAKECVRILEDEK